ncbi:hypothetical protein QE357_000377 [Siphonobacter sp. BAB-5404]|nr:hypothetical protein [Siphonobacter sp. SORGH_AS_0500]
MQGLSRRNLLYRRKFAEMYPDPTFVQRPVAQLLWSHHFIVMDWIKEPRERESHIHKALEHMW